MSSILPFQWLPLTLLLFTLSNIIAASNSSGTPFPRLSHFLLKVQPHPQTAPATDAKDFKTFYYKQTLDHFNYRPESYTTFKQRYIINFKYWGGADARAPIFVYMGEENPLDQDVPNIGFLPDNAAQFKALLVYIEHRFYGQSVPFGSFTYALKHANLRGYFNTDQSLADYATIILYLKKKLNAHYSPVIVVGGSYGGILAANLRLKFPHVTLGSLASSAPVLYYVGLTSPEAYALVVTKDFREASETCYKTIRQSWSEINKLASQPHGLSTLSKMFNTCNPLQDISELTDFLTSAYARAAQYDQPPYYPVNAVCKGIDGAAASGTNHILEKIFGGVVAFAQIFTDSVGTIANKTCYINPPSTPSETTLGFLGWQECSELVIPMATNNETMFPTVPFDLQSYIKQCQSAYGVPPRPYWVTTYYGGFDYKLVLRRFGSNIIFSNGLRDPWSSGGVLENISDTIVALKTINGSHALDILPASPSAPEWLIQQRKTEVEIIKGWIAQYYADLRSLNL